MKPQRTAPPVIEGHVERPRPRVTPDQAIYIEYVRAGWVSASDWLDRLTHDPELFSAYEHCCRNDRRRHVIVRLLKKAYFPDGAPVQRSRMS